MRACVHVLVADKYGYLPVCLASSGAAQMIRNCDHSQVHQLVYGLVIRRPARATAILIARMIQHHRLTQLKRGLQLVCCVHSLVPSIARYRGHDHVHFSVLGFRFRRILLAPKLLYSAMIARHHRIQYHYSYPVMVCSSLLAPHGTAFTDLGTITT